jgi:nucleoprotein TPR
MEQLQQLNLLRESNIMLRDENERNLKRASQWEERAVALENSISPLLEAKKEMSSQIEALSEQKAALESDIAGWRARVQQLLDRHQKVDPEEHKKLVDDHASVVNQLKEKQEELEKVLHLHCNSNS